MPPAPMPPPPAAAPEVAPAPAIEQPLVPVVPVPTSTPRSPLRLAGSATELSRPLHLELPRGPKGIQAAVAVDLDGRVQGVSTYALDAGGTQSSGALAVSPRARLGLVLKSGAEWPLKLMAEYEQDLPTGTATGAFPAGLGMPGSEDTVYAPLRKAYLRLGYQDYIFAGAGVMTAHFGLGLVANDGAHGWEPGSARFADPRRGDRVLRAFLGTGPHTPCGLVLLVAAEKVIEDDALLTGNQLPSGTGDDSAKQLLGVVSLGRPGATWAGFSGAYRDQTSADGRYLHAGVVDLSGTLRRELGPSTNLFVGAEAAYVFGETTLSATPTYPVQTVQQFGAGVRAHLDLGVFGVALDGLFASGDGNLDDSYQNGFRVNKNYDMGFILFSQVMAAQSARGFFTAGDPRLVQFLPTGLERFPTRGAATDTAAFFPRVFVRPIRGIEVYGGALFAWTPTDLIDAFNTAKAGGTPHNALNGTPGSYLGTEVDAGIRARFLLWGTELALGVEGGSLFSGSAFQSATGTVPSAVTAGRVMLGYKL